ncbi:hypothetical protein MMC20_005767 [Loxospora ochrophaea]|nr:hypothetical protein [Loxospora ochrophaea]
MPVTIHPAPHSANAVKESKSNRAVNSAEALLKASCPADFKDCKNIIQSSFSKFGPQSSILPSENGFVYSAIDAYSDHHHLTLRPEDIWFAILTQLSLHINANAEELRSFFVAHEGQKELEIKAAGTIRTVDFGLLAQRMTDLIAINVTDPELRTWIMPSFSTTTNTDKVVASITMMGALQKYFSYLFTLLCGIPSVTLLGIREDWQDMLERLEMLPQLGYEPTQFYNLLKPILTRFVSSFDAPEAPSTKDFWQKIAHRISGGSGPTYLSGWLTAFCFWDADGKSLYAPNGKTPAKPTTLSKYRHRSHPPPYCLDNVVYHKVDMNKIPPGVCSVPVKVNDNGLIYRTKMVAGSVGLRVWSSGDALDDGDAWETYVQSQRNPTRSDAPQSWPSRPAPGLDSLQPESGWWMYELVEETGGEAEGTSREPPKEKGQPIPAIGAGDDRREEEAESPSSLAGRERERELDLHEFELDLRELAAAADVVW